MKLNKYLIVLPIKMILFTLKLLLWAAGAAACWLHSQLGHEVLGREAG